MAMQHEHAPAWLFSFVDLAFLLLIAMTQLSADGSRMAVQLGEIVLPRIASAATTELPAAAPERWQLRVHPPAEPATPPFELTRPGPDGSLVVGERLTADEVRARLTGLRDAGDARPLLAPHADSRSQDMLEAVGLVEEQWPSRRRATVAPVFARQ